MVLYLLAVVVGLVLLTKAADQFVLGAARLAVSLRVSAVVIGAVVVGFGTSAPELVVSVLAAAQDSVDIAVGNIVGSNAANLTLILGIAACIVPLTVTRGTLRREATLSTAAVALFAVLVQGGLAVWEGLVLLAAMAAALGWILASAQRERNPDAADDVSELVGGDDATGGEHVFRTRPEVLRSVVGLVGTVAGAQAMAYGATGVADEIGLAEGFVGLTLVAVGTSLPELVTAVAAARRGEGDLIVGNLLGSNLFNSLFVGGAVAVAGPPGLDDPDLVTRSTIVMVVVAVVAFAFMAGGRRVYRSERIALLVGYAAPIPLLALA